MNNMSAKPKNIGHMMCNMEKTKMSAEMKKRKRETGGKFKTSFDWKIKNWGKKKKYL